jgi:hypothetical protein
VWVGLGVGILIFLLVLIYLVRVCMSKSELPEKEGEESEQEIDKQENKVYRRTCCCGCNLRCAILAFGVLAILNFFATGFNTVTLYQLSYQMIETRYGVPKDWAIGVSTTLMILILAILVGYPAYAYTLYFCTDTWSSTSEGNHA